MIIFKTFWFDAIQIMDSPENIKAMKKQISVILAVRNEEGYIGRCLDSLIDQDMSPNKYEIIVVDGMSIDKTRQLLSEYRTKFPGLLRVFDNPQKIQSAGRNIGIRNAISSTVLIFSGHAYAQSRLLSTLIGLLNTAPKYVAGVGSIHCTPDDETFFGKVMADVQMSFLGGGGTSYRQHNRMRYVDTIAFCAYKKDIIEKIGLHDENLVITEDLDLNTRIRKAGFKLLVCPEAISYYYRRHNSLRLLWKRMVLYGVWRAIAARKHPKSFGVQFLMPIIVIVGLALLPAAIFLYPLLASLILVGLMLYLVTIFANSLYLCAKRRSLKYFLSFPIFAIEHFGIGVGLITGLFRKFPEKGVGNSGKSSSLS